MSCLVAEVEEYWRLMASLGQDLNDQTRPLFPISHRAWTNHQNPFQLV